MAPRIAPPRIAPSIIRPMITAGATVGVWGSLAPKASATPKAPRAPPYSCPAMPMFHSPAFSGMMKAQVHSRMKTERLIVRGRPKALANA